MEDMVWMHMETVISYILRYKDHFRAVVQESMNMESKEKIQAWKKQLTQAEKRVAELDITRTMLKESCLMNVSP